MPDRMIGDAPFLGFSLVPRDRKIELLMSGTRRPSLGIVGAEQEFLRLRRMTRMSADRECAQTTAAVSMNGRYAEPPQSAVETKQQVRPCLSVDQLPEAILASVLLPERFDELCMGREVAIVGDGRIA